MPVKTCFRCNIDREISYFNRCKRSKDGRRGECRECRRKYYLKPYEQVEKWNLSRKERMRQMGLESRGRIVSDVTKKNISEAQKKRFKDNDFTIACLNRDYGRYRKNGFAAGFEGFKKLVFNNCFYCGCKPERKVYNWNKKYFCELNGIDRVENEKGYEIDNCVTCCFNCNKAKSTRKTEEFLEWIKKVYEHNFKG